MFVILASFAVVGIEGIGFVPSCTNKVPQSMTTISKAIQNVNSLPLLSAGRFKLVLKDNFYEL